MSHSPENFPDSLKIENEKYLAARLFRVLPALYGDRGEVAIGAYQYFRWIDDVIDEDMSLSQEEKIAFLEKQISLNEDPSSQDLQPIETYFFKELPWNSLSPEILDQLAPKIKMILSAIKDDLLHQNFVPRNEREMRHYNYRAVVAAIDALGVILNGTSVQPTKKLMDLIHHWNLIGALKDLEEDVANGLAMVPLGPEESKLLTESQFQEILEDVFKKLLTRARFEAEKKRNLKGILLNSSAFLELQMPLWQKVLATLYILGRVLPRSVFTAQYPQSFSSVTISG